MKFRPSRRQLYACLPDRVVQVHGARAAGARYLSFDDGPHPEHTPRLLDLLARHAAKASFFLVGRNVERHPEIVARIVREGHLLGNHSFTHERFGQLPLAAQLDEFARTDAALAGFDGRPRHRLRPPQGSLPLPLLLALARRGRSIAYWSYDSLDYQSPAPEALIDRLRRAPPAAGDIVLMHDDSALAADALTVLLPEWRAAGHSFQALPEERA